MSKKTGVFTKKQLERLPEEGYWLEYYNHMNNPTGYCIMNGHIKYIQYDWGTDWTTLTWTCCITKNQIANPGQFVSGYYHFKTHQAMIDAFPTLPAGFHKKAPNDF